MLFTRHAFDSILCYVLMFNLCSPDSPRQVTTMIQLCFNIQSLFIRFTQAKLQPSCSYVLMFNLCSSDSPRQSYNHHAVWLFCPAGRLAQTLGGLGAYITGLYLPLSPTTVTYHSHPPLSPFIIQAFDSTGTDITSKAVQYKTTLGGLGAYITGLYLPLSPTTVTYHCHLPLSPFIIQAFDSTGTDITSKAVQYKTTLGGLGAYITGLYLPLSPTTVTYHCHPS